MNNSHLQDPTKVNPANSKQENFHRLMLKKIKREIRTGQSILHISDKQNQISEMLSVNNIFNKVSSLNPDELKSQNISRTHKSFSYIILDLDMPCSDNLREILNELAPMIIRPGLLILIGTNLCSFQNKLNLLLNKFPPTFNRPSRAIAPNQLRDSVIEEGFFLKNRYYQYDDLLLMFLDIPQRY
jgi:hypothetical protein